MNLSNRLLDKIRSYKFGRKVNIMEICGTHTVSIFECGIKDVLPKEVRLISGPGCPVCVTPVESIEAAIKIARQKDVIFASFGDMIRVPGLTSSLLKEKSSGADVRIVYSALDCLKIAKSNPDKKVVFFAIGFETTSPTIAMTILEAKKQGINNFFIISAHKLLPPPIKVLLEDKRVRLDGIIGPGHASAIIGAKAYEFIPKKYGIGVVVAGFEPLDIFEAIAMLLNQVKENKPSVQNQYIRVVNDQPNKKALDILFKVFEPCDSNWRGFGVIKKSGLKLRKEFAKFDALKEFKISASLLKDKNTGCACADVIRGIKEPTQCKLFRNTCTPDNPVGACMVSSEGTCAAYYKYGK